MAASTTTTAEFNAAIERIRQRIGTARTSPTMRARPRAARLAGRSAASSCSVAVAKTKSLHLANAFDQLRGRGISLRPGVDARHRLFKRLAVEIRHDRCARGLRLPARTLLQIFPLRTHELAGFECRVAKSLLVLGR